MKKIFTILILLTFALAGCSYNSNYTKETKNDQTNLSVETNTKTTSTQTAAEPDMSAPEKPEINEENPTSSELKVEPIDWYYIKNSVRSYYIKNNHLWQYGGKNATKITEEPIYQLLDSIDPNRPDVDIEYRVEFVRHDEESSYIYFFSGGGCAGCGGLEKSYLVIDKETKSYNAEKFADADVSLLFTRAAFRFYSILGPVGKEIVFIKTSSCRNEPGDEQTIWLFDVVTGKEKVIGKVTQGYTLLDTEPWSTINPTKINWDKFGQLVIGVPTEDVSEEEKATHSRCEDKLY